VVHTDNPEVPAQTTAAADYSGGFVFMMGDNAHSNDSRFWGGAHEEIIGTPLFVHWSYDRPYQPNMTLRNWRPLRVHRHALLHQHAVVSNGDANPLDYSENRAQQGR
jgi:hypothetical protein